MWERVRYAAVATIALSVTIIGLVVILPIYVIFGRKTAATTRPDSGNGDRPREEPWGDML